MPTPQWLIWARKLQAIAQAGLSFADGPFDLQRYREVQSIAAQIVADHTEMPVEKLIDLFSRDAGQLTPKVAVRAAIFRHRELLLVREKQQNRHGRWAMPGGLAGVNETPSQAVAREVLEESGYSVKPTRLLAVYNGQSRRFHNYYTLFFDCEMTGTIQEGDQLETSAAAFFPVDALPELVIEDGRQQIARLFEIHADPHLPPDFD